MRLPDEGGALRVDKPVGPTSHDVVARARRALDERKIGHAGTLDPFASGLLLLCVGPSTRLSEYLTDLPKTYEATALLGRSTDTLDPEGEVVEEDEAWREVDAGAVREALEALSGDQDQVPPQYSAKKVEGERMYRKARRGERVTLEPARVRIHELELVELRLPRLRFRVRCSSGTYVRSLARDLARELGTSGHLVELRRTRIGALDVADAVPADDLERPERVAEAWIPPARAVAHLPAVRIDAERAARMAHGQAVSAEMQGVPPATPVAVLLDDDLVAVAEREGDRLRPRKVFPSG